MLSDAAIADSAPLDTTDTVGRVRLQLPGSETPVDVEMSWVGPTHAAGPVAVFLHEGLGSLAQWRGFPGALCAALGWRGLVYSRPGYGRSTPRPRGAPWGTGFMHHEAQMVLPALRAALGLQAPCWLVGHSDGASIALLHAAHAPQTVAGVVALAPHVFVEDATLAGIRAAQHGWLQSRLREGLGRYHTDAESTFTGWSGAWLDPAFRSWTIEAALDGIACPVLAMQGADDGYGTRAQLDRMQRRLPGLQQRWLPACGHSPHRDAEAAVIVAAHDFMAHPPPPRRTA